jgi:ribosomal protein S27AE
VSGRSRASDARFLFHWPHEIEVECPRCGQRALVHGLPKRLSCTSCGLSRSDGTYGRMEAFIRRRCPRCGVWITRRIVRKGVVQSIAVSCPTCRAVSNVRPTGWRSLSPEASDPWFGLPLWLRTELRGREIWAWNREHLAFLREWLGATLRERVPNVNRSVASRLPAWMKAAGNREDVVRALDRMAART